MGKTQNIDGGYLDLIYGSYVASVPEGKKAKSKEEFTKLISEDATFRGNVHRRLSQVYEVDDYTVFDQKLGPVKKKEPTQLSGDDLPDSSSVGAEDTTTAPIVDKLEVWDADGMLTDAEQSGDVQTSSAGKQKMARLTDAMYSDVVIPGLTTEENNQFKEAAKKQSMARKQLEYLKEDTQASLLRDMGAKDVREQLAEQEDISSKASLNTLLTTAKFRDEDNYFPFYDSATLQPVAVGKDEMLDFVQNFMDTEMSHRMDETGQRFSSIVGKKYESLSADEKLVVQTAFANRYIDKAQFQNYLKAQGIDADLGFAPHAFNKLLGGFINTTASMLEGADPSKMPLADSMNSAIVQAANGMVTKEEYERMFSALQQSVEDNMSGGTYDTYDRLPGITPIKTYQEKRDPRKLNAMHYVYSADQMAAWMAKMPKYQDAVGGAESPYKYENGQLGDVSEQMKRYTGSLRQNPVYNDSFWATKVPEAIGSSAAFLGVAALSRVAPGLNPLPKWFATALAGGMANASDAYNQAIQGGASADKAVKAYWIGMGIGATESVPIERMLNRFNSSQTWKQKLIEAINQGNEEAIQESFQGISNDVLAKLLYDTERQVGEELGSAAAAGWVSGFIMAGSTALMSRKDKTPEQQKVAELIQKNLAYKLNSVDQEEIPDGPGQYARSADKFKSTEIKPIDKSHTQDFVQTDVVDIAMQTADENRKKLKEKGYDVSIEYEEASFVGPDGELIDIEDMPDELKPVAKQIVESITTAQAVTSDAGLEDGETPEDKEVNDTEGSSDLSYKERVDELYPEVLKTLSDHNVPRSKTVEEIYANPDAPLREMLEAVTPNDEYLEAINGLNEQLDDKKQLLKSGTKQEKQLIQEEIKSLQSDINNLEGAVELEGIKFGEDLRMKLMQRAEELGYTISRGDYDDLGDHALPYLTDGRMMEGFYHTETVQTITDKLIHEYYGKISNQETEDASDGEIGDTETIISTGETLIGETETLGEDEDEGKSIRQIDNQIRKIDSKVKKLSEGFDTDEIEHELPSVVVGHKAASEVRMFAKDIASRLNWELAKDKKGKPQKITGNIASAGGYVSFDLAIPGTDLIMYVSVEYDPKYSSSKGYHDYKFKEFFYRVETTNPKAHGNSQFVGTNMWLRENVDSEKFAEVLLNEAKKYIKHEIPETATKSTQTEETEPKKPKAEDYEIDETLAVDKKGYPIYIDPESGKEYTLKLFTMDPFRTGWEWGPGAGGAPR